jgi:hypothetical protein
MLFSVSARLQGKGSDDMIDTKPNGVDSRSYELTSVSAPISSVALYEETFRLLGWTISTGPAVTRSDRVTMHLMRKSPKAARMELVELQARAEGALRKLEVMDRTQSNKARVVGTTVAAMGTAISGLGIFALIGPFTSIPLFLGIIPLAWWPMGIVATRLARNLSQSSAAAEADEQFEIITICGRRAHEILA